jgi:hypothetical protein
MTCFELARKWRDICIQEHGKSCGKATDEMMPSRVIDVGPSDVSHEPLLTVTGGEMGKWVALSHCWGNQSQFVTNSNNLLTRKRMIPLEDMPKTFSDAVFVTCQLGYRYLWIDSLCILQGDHGDWIAESIRMRDYYKHAIVTISADSAPKNHFGFLTERENTISREYKTGFWRRDWFSERNLLPNISISRHLYITKGMDSPGIHAFTTVAPVYFPTNCLGVPTQKFARQMRIR